MTQSLQAYTHKLGTKQFFGIPKNRPAHEMYSLYLTCTPDETDRLSAELWEAGTSGIQELETADNGVLIKAGFVSDTDRLNLLQAFRRNSPQWKDESGTDWVEQTHAAWPGRIVGQQFFVAAPWVQDPTPPGRLRIVQNPGMASGTGEHPCTQLALEALEVAVIPGASLVADVGTGSGILAIGASLLGAKYAVGVDPDELALQTARENLNLNECQAALAAGSADALAAEAFDVVIANISSTVLLAISDELLRILKPAGTLILTGFLASEADAVFRLLPPSYRSESVRRNESAAWSCLISNVS